MHILALLTILNCYLIAEKFSFVHYTGADPDWVQKQNQGFVAALQLGPQPVGNPRSLGGCC